MNRLAALLLSSTCVSTSMLAPSAHAEDAPPLASAAENGSFTLAIVSGLSDVGLLFAFRAGEHFGWSFDIGASFLDDIGASFATDVSYFPNDDFNGFYLGFGGEAALLQDDFDDGVSAVGSHTRLRFNFGWKAMAFGGLTTLVQLSPSLMFDEGHVESGATVTTTTSLRPGIDARLAIGWTF
jgi:hypothetical protein